jgi:hypothetical protein
MFLYWNIDPTNEILQNIAARNPGLSGHVCPLPSDQALRSILAVCLDHCWTSKLYPLCEPMQPQSLICGASVMRGPLVGEACAVASWCVLEVEERDAVVVSVFPLGAQGQNRLFLSHFLLLYCEEDGAAGRAVRGGV